jgi:hypothetical protein
MSGMGYPNQDPVVYARAFCRSNRTVEIPEVDVPEMPGMCQIFAFLNGIIILDSSKKYDNIPINQYFE